MSVAHEVPIRTASSLPYDLPLTTPWRSARGTLSRRRGWLIRIEDQDGRIGWGECAPLPGAGTESHALAGAALKMTLAGLEGLRPCEAMSELPEPMDLPAARCGIECALLDLQASLWDQPLWRMLEPAAVPDIPVNAAVGPADEGLADRLRAALDDGFAVSKVKLGTAPWDREWLALQAARAVLEQGMGLRLDANRAWTPHAAFERVARLAELAPESLEEPLAEFAEVILSALQARVRYALALDESLVSAQWRIETCPVRRIILKPMVLGGALPALALARDARRHGLEVVVTTTVDAAPGRWLAAAVAACTGGDLAHGLDTGRWLEGDVGEGPAIADGRIRLPETPGLGFFPDD